VVVSNVELIRASFSSEVGKIYSCIVVEIRKHEFPFSLLSTPHPRLGLVNFYGFPINAFYFISYLLWLVVKTRLEAITRLSENLIRVSIKCS
jgi:hypothetical protein